MLAVRGRQSVHDSTNPLRLPEDDPVATTNMFHLAHFNTSSVTSNCWDWVQRLFVVCDKYKCTMRFKDYFELQLMRSRHGIISSYSDADAFIMAYLMDDRSKFGDLSESIVKASLTSLQKSCQKSSFLLVSWVCGLVSCVQAGVNIDR